MCTVGSGDFILYYSLQEKSETHLSIRVDVDPFIEGAIETISSIMSEVIDGVLLNLPEDSLGSLKI